MDPHVNIDVPQLSICDPIVKRHILKPSVNSHTNSRHFVKECFHKSEWKWWRNTISADTNVFITRTILGRKLRSPSTMNVHDTEQVVKKPKLLFVKTKSKKERINNKYSNTIITKVSGNFLFITSQLKFRLN